MTPEELPIAVRAFVDVPKPPPRHQRYRTMRAIGPTIRVLVIDTETTTDASQQLRFGVYQLREGDALADAGFFYDPDSLTDDELATLGAEASRLGMKCSATIRMRSATTRVRKWSGPLEPDSLAELN